MTSLPWDRWQPEQSEPEPIPEPPAPELPPPRPTPAPVPPPELILEPEPRPKPPARPDVSDDAIRDALDQLWPDLREDAVGYLKDSWGAIRQGQTVDILHPTVTAEDVSGRELVVADAKSRSWRTLVQGLIFDVFAAIIAAVALLSGMDPLVKETWIAFGVLLLKSVVSAVISYFMRLRVTPTIKLPGEEMAVMPIPRPMKEEE